MHINSILGPTVLGSVVSHRTYFTSPDFTFLD
uniref:Uncharacterized protein n=1 Tax=Anguilla anguilla TaxID=7936 RepID=A0A0E9UB91_ANGAN